VASLAGLNCRALRELRLKGCGNVRSLKPLQACSALRNLDITLSSSAIYRGVRHRQLATMLAHLKPLQNLQHVRLQQCRARKATVFSIQDLLNLERPLGTLVTSAWKSPLATLSLAGCSSLQDSSLPLLQPLERTLTSLSLSKCRGLTGSGFAAIARLSKLVSLDLSECDPADGIQGFFRHSCEVLFVLFFAILAAQHCRCSSLQDSSLLVLQHLECTLTSVSLSECWGPTGSSFAAIPRLLNLMSLDLFECDHAIASLDFALCGCKVSLKHAKCLLCRDV
jgi:hypothetical protein